MLRDKQKKLSQFLLFLFLLTLGIAHIPIHADLTSLAKNDALPMFTTLNWDDAHLLTREQLIYKDVDWAEKKHNRFSFSLSPFAQNADRGKTIKGQTCTLPNPFLDKCGFTLTDTPLADLTGRTGMIALLYNTDDLYPNGETDPGVVFENAPILFEAYKNLFPLQPTGCVDDCEINPGLNDEANIDPDQEFGFFSFPLKYRKRGVRFELAALVAKNFGIRIQAGMSTIRQVREETIDLTQASTFTPVTDTVTKTNTEEFLMHQLDAIADEIGVDLCDFIQTSMEEVRFNIFWRQAFAMNQDAESDWAKFLIIPYVEAGASVSPGKKDNDHKFFAVPFGNNTHPSVGFTTGINLDFLETIEIGGEIGYTHFFKKSFCRPIPNNEFQTNLFPFSTNVSVSPGDNWYFGARIAAYHFIDNLSMYFEWFVLDHLKDEICLENPDPAFVPEVLECTTSFKTKLGNAGFNYDLSPNVAVGFLWQIPFSQRNSYRSSTLMAGFNVTF
ncbi:MAG TPA: hypothetical protein VKR54_03565 [Candidatus Babeliales bacterium]|jgi:hypothetical protein|nr:hypothetical protein [Candidatus Babeliales bacterium]